MFGRVTPLLACLALIACGKEAPPPAAPAPAGQGAAVPPAPAAAPEAPAAAAPEAPAAPEVEAPPAPEAAPAAQAPEAAPPQAAPGLAMDEVLTFLGRWLDAQNRGDLETYRGLYASRFYGVKRSGPRTRSYGRDGWLEDRAQMFKKPMQVAAADVKASLGGQTAVVTFVQTFSRGSYRDEGPKQLVIVREEGRLAIAREEMLASRLAGEAAPPAPLDRADFAFVLTGDAPMIVLQTRVPEAWAGGPPRLAGRGDPWLATKAVADGALPSALAGWPGRDVRLLGERGEVCRGRVEALAVLAAVTPHFGQVQTWEEDKASDAEMAEGVWGLASEDLRLVARVAPAAGASCEGALWARDASRPAPAVAVEVAEPSEALVEAGLAALRALPSYKAAQREFVQQTGEADAAWETYGDAAPAVRVLAGAGEAPRFLVAVAQAGHVCDGFLGEAWGVWRVEGPPDAPRLVLLTTAGEPGPAVEPRVAADLDGDGVPELLAPGALLRQGPAGLGVTEQQEILYLDCPC